MWGSDPCFSSPTHQGHVQSYEHSCDFLPSSFILPSFAWLYVFFSTGQVLLSTLSWCSAGTSVSEGVFLIHGRESMERNVLYVHLLLCHLVLLYIEILIRVLLKYIILGRITFTVISLPFHLLPNLCIENCIALFSLLCCVKLLVTLLCPWDSPGMNTGVSCHALLEGIFPI